MIDVNYPTLKNSCIRELGTPERGKVRDVYSLGNSRLCFVATDRISTHDVVYEQCIPNKGHALTQTAIAAFELLAGIAPSHFLSSPDPNVMIVEKANVYPVEAIVRGVLTGSAWKSYVATGEVCGIKLPKGMKKNQRLDAPIFTPTTKARTGHDENITFAQMKEMLGPVADEIRYLSLRAYEEGLEKATENGGMLVDTKFEWGDIPGVGLGLVDEALTHDSSRFVDIEEYERAFREGRDPLWLDKQVVRDYAEKQGFKGDGPAPHLPDEIILADIKALGGAYKFLTGDELDVPDEPPTNERITRNLERTGII